MIATLIIGGYVLIGAVVALVLAYQWRLDDRLAGQPTDWDEAGPAVVGLGLLWVFAAVFWCGWVLLRWVGRCVDDAVEATVTEQQAENAPLWDMDHGPPT